MSSIQCSLYAIVSLLKKDSMLSLIWLASFMSIRLSSMSCSRMAYFLILFMDLVSTLYLSLLSTPETKLMELV